MKTYVGMGQNLLYYIILPYLGEFHWNNHPVTSYDLGYRLGTVWVPFGQKTHNHLDMTLMLSEFLGQPTGWVETNPN